MSHESHASHDLAVNDSSYPIVCQDLHRLSRFTFRCQPTAVLSGYASNHDILDYTTSHDIFKSPSGLIAPQRSHTHLYEADAPITP